MKNNVMATWLFVLLYLEPVLQDGNTLAQQSVDSLRTLIEQGQKLLEDHEKNQKPDDSDTAEILNALGLLYRNVGEYGEAEKAHLRALAYWEKWENELRRAMPTAVTVTSQNAAEPLLHLAELYHKTGQSAKAETFYRRASAKCPENDPYSASILNGWAVLLCSQADYAKAEPLLVRALSIVEKQPGRDSEQTAQTLNNLAGLCHETGDFAKAEPLYRRALSIREKIHGPDHLEVAIVVNNMAGLYRSIGDFAKAEPLYRRVLAIREKVFGPDHPDVADTLNNLAELYRAAGSFETVASLHERALRIREKSLGVEHPTTAGSLVNLALFYQQMGDYARAESLFQRGLMIRQQSLGREHHVTALSLNNLAVLFQATGRFAEAEPLLRRATGVWETRVGTGHPYYANILDNLSWLLFQSGKGPEARGIANQAQAARLQTMANVLSFNLRPNNSASRFKLRLTPTHWLDRLEVAMSSLRRSFATKAWCWIRYWKTGRWRRPAGVRSNGLWLSNCGWLSSG